MGNWGHQGGFLFILLAQATARTQKKKPGSPVKGAH